MWVFIQDMYTVYTLICNVYMYVSACGDRGGDLFLKLAHVIEYETYKTD